MKGFPITRIHLHDAVLDVTASPRAIAADREGPIDEPLKIELSGAWKAAFLDEAKKPIEEVEVKPPDGEEAAWLVWRGGRSLRLERS